MTLSQRLYLTLVLTCLSFVSFPYIAFALPLLGLLLAVVVKAAQIPIIDSLRLDALTRGPVNSLFAACLTSLPTIRAFNRQAHFTTRFDALVD